MKILNYAKDTNNALVTRADSASQVIIHMLRRIKWRNRYLEILGNYIYAIHINYFRDDLIRYILRIEDEIIESVATDTASIVMQNLKNYQIRYYIDTKDCVNENIIVNIELKRFGFWSKIIRIIYYTEWATSRWILFYGFTIQTNRCFNKLCLIFKQAYLKNGKLAITEKANTNFRILNEIVYSYNAFFNSIHFSKFDKLNFSINFQLQDCLQGSYLAQTETLIFLLIT